MCPESNQEDYEALVEELESDVQYMLIVFSLVIGFALTILVDLVISSEPSVLIFIIISSSAIINLMGLSLAIRYVTFPVKARFLKEYQPDRYEWMGMHYIEGFAKNQDYDQKAYSKGMLEYFKTIKYVFFLSLIFIALSIIVTIIQYVLVKN